VKGALAEKEAKKKKKKGKRRQRVKGERERTDIHTCQLNRSIYRARGLHAATAAKSVSNIIIIIILMGLGGLWRALVTLVRVT
jgi:hypothetical protein